MEGQSFRVLDFIIPMQNPSSKRNLRLIRIYYFLWIGAGGFLSPFVTLFYKARGLTGTEIGLLSTFGAITGMLAAPVWGRRETHPVIHAA